MVITANDIAALAILTGMAGVLLTNRHQRALARQEYLLDHRTGTYLKVLKEVRRQEVMITAAVDHSRRLLAANFAPFDLSVEDATALTGDDPEFFAEVTAFASQAVVRRWLAFQRAATSCRALGHELRTKHDDGVHLVREKEAVRVNVVSDEFERKRIDLVRQIRFELETSRRIRVWPTNRRRRDEPAPAAGQSTMAPGSFTPLTVDASADTTSARCPQLGNLLAGQAVTEPRWHPNQDDLDLREPLPSVIVLSPEYGAELPLWGEELGNIHWALTKFPPELLDRLAAWQREFDHSYDYEAGWRSAAAQDSWAHEAEDLAADLRAALGPRAELVVNLWPLGE